MTTSFEATANSDMSLIRNSGLFATSGSADGRLENPGAGSETVGLDLQDEPSTMSQLQQGIVSTPCSVQNGRFWWQNNTWNFFAYGGIDPLSSSRQVLAATATTPCGTQRKVDIPSVDIYWFAGLAADIVTQCGLIYNVTCSGDTAARGSNYGNMVDLLRGFETPPGAEPVMQIVEDGGPYNEDTSGSDYITPPEVNWGVWSSLIHGARLIVYFNHSFAGPAQSDDNLAQPYYQTPQNGQPISIYAQVKATNALIKQLAPEINSPTATGYVSVAPAAGYPFGGIETRATYDGSRFTIFADTRDSESQTNISATFTTADHYSGPVTVVCDGLTGGDGRLNPGRCVNRTITATNGVFTDTFAKGSTVHIYQIPYP